MKNIQLIKIKRNDLIKPLKIINNIVERSPLIKIINNILIIKKYKKISFLATNLELQIIYNIDFEMDKSEFTVAVESRKLLSILRVLSNDVIKLILKKSRLLLKIKKNKFILQTSSLKDFPFIIPSEFPFHFTISRKEIYDLLNKVYFSMGKEDVRYHLNGIFFKVNLNKLIIVATDGHRLSYAFVKMKFNESINEIIIPSRTVIQLQYLLKENKNEVDIYISKTQAKFIIGNVEIITKLVSGKFPDFRKIIKNTYKIIFKIDKNYLKNSIKKIILLTYEKFKVIKFILKKNKLILYSRNSNNEEAQDELIIDYNGDDIEIGLNALYLLDFLKNINEDIIYININNNSSDILLKIENINYYKYIVMPIKI